MSASGAGPTLDRFLPGDPDPAEQVHRMIRVDHAGEVGATRIYAGQLAILKTGKAAEAIRHMAAQEARHRAAFDQLMADRRVRPTLFGPLWDIAGFTLGAATALLGERAAMACTVAVEEVIDEHYLAQEQALGEREPELRATIAAFRAEENDHREAALGFNPDSMPFYAPLAAAIKLGSKLAIFLSTRV